MRGAADHPLGQETEDIRAAINAVHAFLASEWTGVHNQHNGDTKTEQSAVTSNPAQDPSVDAQTQPAQPDTPHQQYSSDHTQIKSVQSMPVLSDLDIPVQQSALNVDMSTHSEMDADIPRRTSSLTRSQPGESHTPHRRREVSESSTEDDGRLRLSASLTPASLRRSTRGTSKALGSILTKID